jgi:cytoskeletal protein CcmA (bactofilin family)
MRRETLQRRLYWWGNKKPDTPQPVTPESKNLQMNQLPKPVPASWEGTTKMNKDVMRPTGATADSVTARLGSNLHVKGEITGNEDLYIDGTVEGAVQLGEGKLTVGATANVTADIIAREVVVCGKMKGNVHAKVKIEIKKDGSVIGDLTTAQIIIEDGAYFKGSIEIDRSADKEADNTVSSRTASTPTTPAAAGAGPRSI